MPKNSDVTTNRIQQLGNYKNIHPKHKERKRII